MRWWLGPVVLCVLFVFGVTASVCLLPQAAVQYTAEALYDEYMPSVVEIYAKRTLFSKDTYRGTGFFISEDGMLVTAAHVLYFEDEGMVATQVRVSIGDEEHFYKAKIVKVDLEHDVALLKVMQFSDLAESNGYTIDSGKAKKLNRRFKYMTMDYDYEPHAGDLVFTLGNPSKFRDVVSQGMIISNRIVDLEMKEDSLEFEDMVLTSLYLRPGNSGGPVFNGAGKVIGVATVGAGSGPMSLYQKAKYIKAMLDDTSDEVIISQQRKLPAEETESEEKEEGEDSDKKALLP